MTILELRDVDKSFGGRKVLGGLSLKVEQGSIYGFLGRNGAGKTTTMKLVMGLLAPDGGEILMAGQPMAFGASRGTLAGYLPDVPEFYGFMTPREYLRMCGEIARVPRAGFTQEAADLLHEVGLDGANRRIGGFSRGMRQRLGIAQALLGSPKLLLCDEPTSALDPVGRRDILQILEAVKARTTVVFSTHILADAERICDQIGVLEGGRIMLEGGMDEIKTRRRGGALTLELGQSVPQDLPAQPFVAEAELQGRTARITLKEDGDAHRALLEYLLAQNLELLRLETAEASLEDLFMEAIG